MKLAFDIKRELSTQGYLGYCDPVILDAEYSFPTKEWIDKEFSEAWFNYRTQISSYHKESWDCDNYAFTAFTFAQMCHRRLGDTKTGLAFGVVCYLRGGTESHAANIFLTREGDSAKIWGFEPQTNKVFKFTDHEIESITVIII